VAAGRAEDGGTGTPEPLTLQPDSAKLSNKNSKVC